MIRNIREVSYCRCIVRAIREESYCLLSIVAYIVRLSLFDWNVKFCQIRVNKRYKYMMAMLLWNLSSQFPSTLVLSTIYAQPSNMSFPAGFRPISPVDPVVSERTNERAKRNRDLLNSGQGADFTVTCRDQVWKVHEAIVCPSSKFIASALESGFRESGSRNVTIDYDEPALICRMLKCFYVFNYSDTVKDDLPDMETLSWPWVQDLPASDSHKFRPSWR